MHVFQSGRAQSVWNFSGFYHLSHGGDDSIAKTKQVRYLWGVFPTPGFQSDSIGSRLLPTYYYDDVHMVSFHPLHECVSNKSNKSNFFIQEVIKAAKMEQLQSLEWWLPI